MKYKELMDLGFKRQDLEEGFESLGFYNFYLFFHLKKDLTLEWNWQNTEIVKMVNYKNNDVQNYIEILDLQTMNDLIYLFIDNVGNKGVKPQIGKQIIA